MSSSLIARSPDLQLLRDEGYDLAIESNHLLIKGVPYVTPGRVVAFGTLVSELSTAGDQTTVPGTHVAFFVGMVPCDQHGRELSKLVNNPNPQPLGEGLVASCSFSQKPAGGYADYHHKMTTYVNILLGPARAIDSAVTATSFPPIATDEEDSVFRYFDSATSRARIGAAADKLRGERIVIVGLGGTGAYILDLVAKTPVSMIDLYDDDVFLTHNAFRAPGAATLDELRARPTKVEHWRRTYDAMRREIVAHPERVDESNVGELRRATFAFLAIDSGPSKRLIIETLEDHAVPFIDTGMGVYQRAATLGGVIRTSFGNPGVGSSLLGNDRVSFADPEGDEYAQNIQIAELNMLAAALAVIRWKKHLGVYLDLEGEHFSAYTIDGNHLLNEDLTA